MRKISTKMLAIALFLSGTAISFVSFAQTTYYVSTIGDNVNLGTTAEFPKRNIQQAVYAANNGDIIVISSGVYEERVYIDKSLTFKGANAGIDAASWSNVPTIVRPNNTSFATTAASSLFEIVANNVTIDGIAFQGDNNNLSDASPKTLNGTDIRTNYGVMAYQNFSGQKILNSKFFNFCNRGISFSTGSSNLSIVGNEIKNNQFDNISATSNDARGIYLNNYIVDISNNSFTRVDYGLFYESNTTTAHDATNLNISNNTMEAYFRGVLMYFATNSINPATLIEGNNISWSDISSRVGTGITATTSNSSRGIAIENARGNSQLLIKNNSISGLNEAVFAISVEKSTTNPNRFTIQGGIFSNTKHVGITLRNDLGVFASRMVIEGVNILNAGTSGVQVYGHSNPVKTEIALKNGVNIQRDVPIPGSYNHAIYLEGVQATLTELGNTKITGSGNRLITLFNNAMQGLEVDGTYMTFDGLVNGYTFDNYKPAENNNTAIAIALQERILDSNPHSWGTPNGSAGLVRFNFGITLPVSLIGFNAVPTQQGVRLNWTTASESGNSHFIIEKSTDGVSFSSIKETKGNGTSSQRSDYSFTDLNFDGDAYYLLKQVDTDGKITVYDNLIRYVAGLGNTNNVVVYPNPATENLTVKNMGKNAQITIYDYQGKQVFETRSSGEITLQIGSYTAGNYIIQLKEGNTVRKYKFTKL